ncbi:MAG: Fe-S cluster assembly protein SufD [Brumimicrobium sp.]|nr:Fe-S cluster assembly protein SufD [Brumimicrobium sp.]
MEMVAENKVIQFVKGFDLPPRTGAIRKEALQALQAMDFPTTKVEDWKYTRVTRITNKNFEQRREDAETDNFLIPGMEAHVLVFINGYFSEKRSLIREDDEAVSILSIEELNDLYYSDLMDEIDENVFSLINKAYHTGGKFIQVAANKKAKYPVHLIHVVKGEQVIANVRHFVHLEKGAELELVGSFHSEDASESFTNVVFEGHLEENAHLSLNKLQFEDKEVFHIAREFFVQDQSSNFKINTVTTGGLITRNSLDVFVEGENCHTELNGVYMGTSKQHMDNHTLIEHLFSNCTSSETYKGVMDDKSTGVFNGKVIVRQDAQKIEAYQSNGNVLLSDHASVNSKPELEIYADDVRCSHGSTIGQLNQDAVFYLRSRGISEEKAKRLIVSAFIAEVLDKISSEPVRNFVDKHFYESFGWGF